MVLKMVLKKRQRDRPYKVKIHALSIIFITISVKIQA